jgi:hypothetical protein
VGWCPPASPLIYSPDYYFPCSYSNNTYVTYCIRVLITATLSYPQNSNAPSPPIYTSKITTESSCQDGYPNSGFLDFHHFLELVPHKPLQLPSTVFPVQHSQPAIHLMLWVKEINAISATEAGIGCQTHYQFSKDDTAHMLVKTRKSSLQFFLYAVFTQRHITKTSQRVTASLCSLSRYV